MSNAQISGNKQERQRFILLCAGGALLMGLAIFLASLSGRSTPIEDKTYYRGPIYNHNGDLVDGDGKILKRAVLPSATKRTRE